MVKNRIFYLIIPIFKSFYVNKLLFIWNIACEDVLSESLYYFLLLFYFFKLEKLKYDFFKDFSKYVHMGELQ